jgi:DNA helicase II / ATP-dependent DNA helicase PcrA
MSIKNDELFYEKNKLQDTRQWLDNEVEEIKRNNDELKDRIASLKKQSRGGYNEELETAKRLYEITSKNYENYNEAEAQPYFARIDFREYRRDRESYYIGKFGLGDSKTGDEVVIDWRAPIADLYYSGTQGEAYYQAPIGVINGELSLKRKFLFKDEELKDAFDEGINEIIIRAGLEDENALIDEYLRINLEQSISTKLKDVVATIQKEQNSIIRADKNQPVIVQGSAGSGKTTVALHRLAYLIYRYKGKISGDDILVVAPNKLFLDYISEVLPNLGVDKVKQKTFEEVAFEILQLKGRVYTKDKKLSDILEDTSGEDKKYITNSSKVKGTLVYKTMMDRYIQVIEKRDSSIEDIKVEDYILFEKSEIKRLYTKDLINFPINKRKVEIKRYLGLKLNEKISNIMDKLDFSYEYLIARTKKTMEDGKERRQRLIELYDERDKKKADLRAKSKIVFDDYFDAWTCLEAGRLYLNLFNDEELFKEVTGDKIPMQLAEHIKAEINKNDSENIVDSDDLAAMLYLKFKIEGVPEKYRFNHIVIDEAQDYSLFQLLVLKEMAYNYSLTIVGDLGQGIYYYKGIESWEKVISEVFGGEAAYMPLTQSYRSTVEIISLANEVLRKQKNNLKPAVPVLRHGKEPQIVSFENPREFVESLDNIVNEVKALNKNSVAVIGRTYNECKKIKDILKKYSNHDWDVVKENEKTLKLDKIIIPSYMTKGLEFDCSVIYNCSKENYSNSELDKRLLYVSLTRALHLEYIFYNGEPSELITEFLTMNE